MGGARTDHDPPDGSPAAETGLTGTLVDAQVLLHRPVALGSRVVVDGAAPPHDGLGEDPPDLEVEAPFVRGSKRRGGTKWMKPGRPQGLVGIDVADAGDERLVKEERLQPTAPASKPRPERSYREGVVKRLGPRPGEDRGATEFVHRLLGDWIQGVQPDPAELPDVPEAQVAAVAERDHHAHVRIQGCFARHDEQLAGHLEMHRQDRIAGETQHELLAASSHPLDPTTCERRTDGIGGVRSHGPGPEDRRGGDFGVENEAAEVPRHGLDLREFGHVRIPAPRRLGQVPRPGPTRASSIPSRSRP